MEVLQVNPTHVGCVTSGAVSDLKHVQMAVQWQLKLVVCLSNVVNNLNKQTSCTRVEDTTLGVRA